MDIIDDVALDRATPCDIVQLRIHQFNQPYRVLWQHCMLLLVQTQPVLLILLGPDDISVCHGILLCWLKIFGSYWEGN